jgi:hypothetical protein
MMAGFATFAEIVAAEKEAFHFDKTNNQPSDAAGVWTSHWLATGWPAAGAAPAATPGTTYTSDQTTPVTGSVWFYDRSPEQKHLLSLSIANRDASATSMVLMLYDRLVAVSGISLATTGNKTVNSTALPRYSGVDAINNEAWLEVTTACTTTTPVVNLNQYTSADGTTGLSGGSVTFPTTAVVSSFIQLPLSSTKRGVRSVEVGVNVGTAAAAGAANLVILRPLLKMHVRLQSWTEVNLHNDIMNLSRIYDDACLAFASVQPAGTIPSYSGTLQVASA